ncbi:MAG TPA: hypothetical protein VE733_13445 [Streptosporangiaceae bacterium]|jgi:hypothetical protein|nr:hypothetical protein [Streptosporangiaceae bacterium]
MSWPGRIGYGAGQGTGAAGVQDPREILGDRLREGSLYRLLADHGHQMFPDDYFADLGYRGYSGDAPRGLPDAVPGNGDPCEPRRRGRLA